MATPSKTLAWEVPEVEGENHGHVEDVPQLADIYRRPFLGGILPGLVLPRHSVGGGKFTQSAFKGDLHFWQPLSGGVIDFWRPVLRLWRG